MFNHHCFLVDADHHAPAVPVKNVRLHLVCVVWGFIYMLTFPTGIPMGLGAGFKWHEREKDKERPTDKERDREKEKEKEKEVEKLKDKVVDRPKSRKEKEDTSREHDPLGWTAMCEDWLCNGGGGTRVSGPTIADVGAPQPLMRRAPSKEPKRGPYQLLIKERLMGIYMAIYVHRDIQALVRGTKSFLAPTSS